MAIVVTWQSITTAGAVLGACGVIVAAIVKTVRWFDKQAAQDDTIEKQKQQHDDDIQALHEKHDTDMAELRADIKAEFTEQRSEMQLIMQGVLASLKGLSEQGCNGPVTTTIKQLEDYLNEKAHGGDINI